MKHTSLRTSAIAEQLLKTVAQSGAANFIGSLAPRSKQPVIEPKAPTVENPTELYGEPKRGHLRFFPSSVASSQGNSSQTDLSDSDEPTLEEGLAEILGELSGRRNDMPVSVIAACARGRGKDIHHGQQPVHVSDTEFTSRELVEIGEPE